MSFKQSLRTHYVSLAAAVILARKEKWRRQAVWDLVEAFSSLTKIPVASPIISLVLGDEKTCHKASR